MKTTLLALLLCLLSIASYAQGSPNLHNVNLDAKNGFRDIQFGAPLLETKGLVLVENGGNSKYYKRPADKLSIGDGQLTRIIYCFYKGRLASVMFECLGAANGDAVRKVLEASYGPGYQPNEFIDKWAWFGEKVSMSFEVNSVSRLGRAHIISEEITAQQAQDEASKAEKSKGDL